MISQSVEAELLTDGRVKLVLPLSNLLLINLALWTTGTVLEWDEKRFRELTGLSPTKVQSLNDEMIAVRYALEGSPPWLNPRTGECCHYQRLARPAPRGTSRSRSMPNIYPTAGSP